MLTLTYIGIAVGSVITTATIVVLIWGLLKGLRRVLHIKPPSIMRRILLLTPWLKPRNRLGGTHHLARAIRWIGTMKTTMRGLAGASIWSCPFGVECHSLMRCVDFPFDNWR